MAQEVRSAHEVRRQSVGGRERDLAISKHPTESAPDGLHHGFAGGLVEADGDRRRSSAFARRDRAQVDPLSACARDDLVLPLADRDREGVEKGLVQRRKAELAEPAGKDRGPAVHPARDLGKPFGSVIDGIHRGDHREQHLCGADIRRRLLAPDVLFAGLQGEPIGRCATRIDR